MDKFEKSSKLDHVCYDIRGPVLDEADRMNRQGMDILKLNIGNPAPFQFMAPDEIVKDMMMNLRDTEGYSDSKGLFSARKAIMQYCQYKKIPNVGIDDIYTGNGVSELITMSMQGLLNPGDHVITTQLEHNSVLRPLYEMEEKGVDLTIVKADVQGRCSIADMEAAIRPETKAIICTHGSNVTGNLVNIAAIGAMTQKYGILFVVDASQTAGVFPIDVQAMHIDILCFTGHKSLLGPQGTGGLYVRTGLQLRPLKSGGSGVQTYSKKHPQQMPTALEAGTLNGHGIAGLDAALDYLKQTGMDEIREKEQTLMWQFYEGIRDISGVKIYGDFSQKNRCPIVSFNIGDYDSAEVSDELYEGWEISTRPGGHCAPLMHEALGTVEQGAVRFSFSHYNTEQEVETAIEAVRELAEE